MNIVALATASGIGAIAVIRISGNDAIIIADHIFSPYHKGRLIDAPTHTAHLGILKDGDRIIDECLVTIFKGKKSYTGEPTVEFSCHGSPYIVQEIIKICLKNGCRLAQPGEFTKRAFLNGKLDLSQAEAVADLIASDSKASHQVAMQQMRGGFTHKIKQLRSELLDFTSLLELELDFSEEDVEFADRSRFRQLLQKIELTIRNLVKSFSAGNVIKNGIPVAIVGKPNAGKSTLLNTLLNEERAIVSDIAGTTRDTIEEVLYLEGISFRFIDTAGIRETSDKIEEIGVKKAKEKIQQARILLYLFDEKDNSPEEVINFVKEVHHKDLKVILLSNKMDVFDKNSVVSIEKSEKFQQKIKNELFTDYASLLMGISAKEGTNVGMLKSELVEYAREITSVSIGTVVTNIRHYEALINAQTEIKKVTEGLQNNLSSDLLSIDIRAALYHLGTITGQVTNDEILGNIFANFCIGK